MKLDAYLSREKLSHRAFAERIGVSQAAITRYVKGARIPHRDEMRRIREVTRGEVSPDDFYGGANEVSDASEAAA